MSVDINHKQSVTNYIAYYWWCSKCQMSHSSPCCPNVSDDELMYMSICGIPGFCQVCGRSIWEHGMTIS